MKSIKKFLAVALIAFTLTQSIVTTPQTTSPLNVECPIQLVADGSGFGGDAS